MKKLSFSKSALTLMLLGSAAPAHAELFYGLSQNTLFSFDSSTPGTIGGLVPISGLGGDSLIGLDLRPATGELYGLGSSLRFYTIDPTSGLASLVNGTPFGTSAGANYGFDFNPVPGALRVVNDGAQNFRVSPTGTLLGNDGTLAYAVGDPNFGQDPSITAVAYGNNVPGAATTFLRGIDTSTDAFVSIPTPNNGVANTIGLLGVNTTERAAFDISGFSGNGYASLTLPGDSFSGFYSINLTTGSASLVGQIGFGGALDGLTAAAVPEPSTWALLSLGMAGLLRRALRKKN